MTSHDVALEMAFDQLQAEESGRPPGAVPARVAVAGDARVMNEAEMDAFFRAHAQRHAPRTPEEEEAEMRARFQAHNMRQREAPA